MLLLSLASCSCRRSLIEVRSWNRIGLPVWVNGRRAMTGWGGDMIEKPEATSLGRAEHV